MFDASAPGGDTEGNVHRWRWRFRRCTNSRDSMWAYSMNGTHAVCVRAPHSSTRARRLELSIGRCGWRRWSPRERTTWTPPLHTRLADRAICAYKAPGYRRRLRLQNRKTLLGRPRAQRPAATKPRPRPPPPGDDQLITGPQNTP